MTQPVPADSKATTEPPAEKQDNFFVFLIKLALIVVIFRSFVFAPFNIPSESMMPRLLQGDYLLAAKWPYGYSRHSLPFSVPLISQRFFASQPERGDVVIFKAPPNADIDYIKRVIGLPGDQVQMRDGQLFLNGEAIPKKRIADLVVPVTATTRCYDARYETRLADGSVACRYAQYRETLPGGRGYNVLDVALTPQDDTEVVVVPEGMLFLMGDNRDNSLDSRFPAVPGQGIGIVPQDYLVGKASVVMFSTDGNAQWLKPWTWFTAARWGRIGGTF
jgi:signal peptidase I